MAMRAKDCGVRERAWFAVALPTMHLAWGSGFLRGLVTGGCFHLTSYPNGILAIGKKYLTCITSCITLRS